MKTGILYLIPAALGTPATEADTLAHIIPETVKDTTARLSYLIAENAKSARAHLKEIAKTRELRCPIQQIRIAELNIKTDKSMLPLLLEPILAGQDGGLISEAGVPAVADPGANLVELAHQASVPVRPLVGPSSILLALMASGLNGQRFAFNGYLPARPAERAKQIRTLENRSRQEKETQIFIETPYRNQALMEALCENCRPSTQLCLATDLTLPTESIQTCTISQWQKKLASKSSPDIRKRPSLFLFLAN
ncbi:MAG: SAM-dependent methyltransferase [Alistipes senegalensis]|nr:SAM-dependent methyltransferase [Oxalobacter formigenes]MCM1281289.1 SAM-dependent methyltransferase [Alistipes senegalensis]